ncbi:hypothetical protein GGR52DRAFT_549728 [Hypoxylon sp. FL1284]|nr:hypothetical protein GGR52DRAFT_549728 [Hypoxylon sp. FL1284]
MQMLPYENKRRKYSLNPISAHISQGLFSASSVKRKRRHQTTDQQAVTWELRRSDGGRWTGPRPRWNSSPALDCVSCRPRVRMQPSPQLRQRPPLGTLHWRMQVPRVTDDLCDDLRLFQRPSLEPQPNPGDDIPTSPLFHPETIPLFPRVPDPRLTVYRISCKKPAVLCLRPLPAITEMRLAVIISLASFTLPGAVSWEVVVAIVIRSIQGFWCGEYKDFAASMGL